MTALIPFQRFEIKTRLGQEITRQKLDEIVEPRKLRFWISRNHNLFEGEVGAQSFKISRVIGYRNSFLPILVGQIRDDLDASTLQITARLNLATLIIWPILLLVLLGAAFFSADVSNPFMLLLLIAFFYALPIGLFNYELNKAKKLLKEQFESDGFSFP